MINLNSAIADKINKLSHTTLSGHYIFSREFDDEYLSRRFSTPDKYPHNIGQSISYAITTDPKHIQQYYAIRQEAYKVLVGNDFYAGEDEFDSNSYFLVATAGNNCIGGIRLTVSTPESPKAMPMETRDFKIKDAIKGIDFTKTSYCEISRLAVLPEYRNGYIWDNMLEMIAKFLVNELNVEILVGRSNMVQIRRTAAQFKNMGYNLIVRPDIKLPHTNSIEHLKMRFLAVDFSPEQKYTSALTGKEIAQNTAEEAYEAPLVAEVA